MTKYIALLRAVNLGGATQVSMTALRDLLARMGLKEVRSLLQSGNLIFRCEGCNPSELETRLEIQVGKVLDVHTDFFVRTEAEWRTIVAQNPFPHEASHDPGHLTVTALKQAPEVESWAALRAAVKGPERVQGLGRQAYIVYPDGTGRSKLTARLIETKLGTRGTSRNWNTVSKLHALVSN